MKRKWLAGCLACLLLLCGCQRTDGFAGYEISGEAEDLSVQSNRLRIKAVVFEDVDTYRETVGKICSKKEIDDLFYDKPGAPIREKDMTMLLEDGFILIPKTYGGSLQKVSFLGSGVSVFWMVLPDGCTLLVNVYHDKRDAIDDLYPDVERQFFETVDGSPVAHWCFEKESTSDGERRSDRYYIETNGYLVQIFDDDFCACKKNAVKNLTFEKVEIK